MNLPSYDLRLKLNILPLLNNYIKEEKIMDFDSALINKIKNTNVPMLRDFFQIFEEGLNIGTCGLTSRYLSYLFYDFILVEEGKCNILIGTKGSPKGEHSWLLVDGYVYDTTLMLKIEKDLAYSELGYVSIKEMTSEKIVKDDLYVLQRELAMDKSDLKWKKDLIKKFKKYNLKCSILGVK
jgi:hypothetical protein